MRRRTHESGMPEPLGESSILQAPPEQTLQQRFEAMRARKQAAAARVKAAEKAKASGPRPADVKKALREGYAPIIGLQSTGEAALDRAVAAVHLLMSVDAARVDLLVFGTGTKTVE